MLTMWPPKFKRFCSNYVNKNTKCHQETWKMWKLFVPESNTYSIQRKVHFPGHQRFTRLNQVSNLPSSQLGRVLLSQPDENGTRSEDGFLAWKNPHPPWNLGTQTPVPFGGCHEMTQFVCWLNLHLLLNSWLSQSPDVLLGEVPTFGRIPIYSWFGSLEKNHPHLVELPVHHGTSIVFGGLKYEKPEFGLPPCRGKCGRRLCGWQERQVIPLSAPRIQWTH